MAQKLVKILRGDLFVAGTPEVATFAGLYHFYANFDLAHFLSRMAMNAKNTRNKAAKAKPAKRGIAKGQFAVKWGVRTTKHATALCQSNTQ